MNYYFLAASLPSFSLDGPPPMPLEKFRALCAERMTRDDLEALDELERPVTEDSRHGFVRAWRQGEVRLRNALVLARSARLQRDAADFLREQTGFDASAERAASDALSRKTPAEGELALDRFRWRQIEELAGFDVFSGRALLAYALKLRLAERWARMSAPAGRERAEAVVHAPPPAAEPSPG